MNRSGKLHALLATARVANIPSVLSNVWLGVAMGLVLLPGGTGPIPWLEALCLMCSAVFLYVSGNFLNDWMDSSWDQERRPERALPRALFQPSFYLIVAVLCAASGVALAVWVSAVAAYVAALIVACIVIYTLLHKRTAWSVIPMGLCRAFLPVMGALGLSDASVPGNTGWHVCVGAAPLFCYIVGISLVARSESLPAKNRRSPVVFFFVPVALSFYAFVAAALWDGNRWLPLLGIIPYALWIVFCDVIRLPKVFRSVSLLLAGIPLVDWIFLLPTGLLAAQSNAGLHSFGIACIMIPPLASVSAILLQRLAPAT